ncbi:hypothetical protein QDR37_12985 [Amnibacterium sp. CER49]|uniref:hypothetical protein n=1 Tax=Amnibacterium sp. CER49 TaxID=3039161 RepID=UPI00244C3169|nr:hypothetical protein [Amnibacterium sp. CER49]MDH2444864.1 hypothetical protein [Amnibacterium sp. CER49]
MTLTEHALRGAVLRAGSVNRLPVGLPWYRSLPLSAVRDVELLLDGTAVPGLRLRLERGAVEVAALGAMRDTTWFLQDRQVLEWGAPVESAAVGVVLRIRLQLPNLLGPDGAPVQVLQEVRGRVDVEGAG